MSGAGNKLKVEDVVSQARDVMTVKRVFGDPYERDGVTFIPVARLGGGGGGGGGEGAESAEKSGSGFGIGLGLGVEPAGAYVIQNGTVRWQPAVDPTRIIARLATVAIFLVIGLTRSRGRRR